MWKEEDDRQTSGAGGTAARTGHTSCDHGEAGQTGAPREEEEEEWIS
jgi:hypothetical protein